MVSSRREILLLDPPRLGGLYAKVAAGAIGRSSTEGGELPQIAARVPDISVERDHLARYSRLCGFPLGDVLPPTYPHILGFPPSMAVMTSDQFPFGVLGMVHISNTIIQRHPVPVSEKFDVLAWVENLRPHPKGVQLDNNVEVRVAGETLWESTSTYLKRSSTKDSDRRIRKARPHRRARGQGRPQEPLPLSARWDLPRDLGRRYARISGDSNPIHISGLAAKLFGFDRAIVHGMWTKARALSTLVSQLPDAFTAETTFHAPLYLPGQAELRTTRSSAKAGEWIFAVTGNEGQRTHLRGRLE